MSKPSIRSELARDISREYQAKPAAQYDATLNALRWLGPQIPHTFHKCYSDKQEKLLTTNQKERGDHIRSWSLNVGK
jgi:hypothetical protein